METEAANSNISNVPYQSVEPDEFEKQKCTKNTVVKSTVLILICIALIGSYLIGRWTSPRSKSIKSSDELLNCDYTQTQESLSGTPFLKGSYFPEEQRPFERIEFEVVTVDNLTLAFEFYHHILGGIEVNFSNSDHDNNVVTYWGDIHQKAMFGYLATNQTVPDISDNGTYMVRSRFLAFGNAVIQLIQFVSRNPSVASDIDVFDLRESLTSPCYIGAAHIDFWIEDDIDMNDYINHTETSAHQQGMSSVEWNRPVVQQSRADRAKVPVSQYANKVESGPFGGLEWSYFKGPIGEQLELYKITGTMKKSVGAAYCERGAVSPAFVTQSASANERKNKPINQRMHGVFQFGFRTDNLHGSVGFYTEVMGGNLITFPTHGIDIVGDDAHWMILAKETLQAYEMASNQGLTRQQAMRQHGVANISEGGQMRLDHRFILFDNFVVEPLLYTDGLTFGARGFNPTWEHKPNPAYIGTVSGAFGIGNNTNLLSALEIVRERSKNAGFANAAAFFPDYTATFARSHPYHGLEYSYGSGSASEVLAFVKAGGHFREALLDAFATAGTVSTLSDATNVYKNGQMDKFCRSVM